MSLGLLTPLFFLVFFALERWAFKTKIDMINLVINFFIFIISAAVAFLPRMAFTENLNSNSSEYSAFYFITALILLDFVTYHWHYLNHKIPFLWKFHAVHHSDRNLNSSSAFRFHFVEVFLGTILRLGVFSLLGISIVYFLYYEVIFQFFNIFQHSNIRLPNTLDKYLSYLFITPNVHHYHHYDKLEGKNAANFGTIFSFWDFLHQSFYRPNKLYPTGLPNLNRRLNLKDLLFLRFPR